jgi:hypothetical protein
VFVVVWRSPVWSFHAALNSLSQRLTDRVDPDEIQDKIALKAIKAPKHPSALSSEIVTDQFDTSWVEIRGCGHGVI